MSFYSFSVSGTFDSSKNINQNTVMKQIENLRDLLIEQGRELQSAEKQQLTDLPMIEKQASSRALKKIINKQIDKTKNQQIRIKQVFQKLNASLEGQQSEPYNALVNFCFNLIEDCTDYDIRDVAIINGIQHINRHKIAGYGTIAAYAEEIGNQDAASLLHESLKDEKSIYCELRDLAINEVNKAAAVPVIA